MDDKKIQDIINYIDSNADREFMLANVAVQLREAVKPKPTFVKGEIVEQVTDRDTIIFKVHNLSESTLIDCNNTSYLASTCRKLESLPISLTPHDSPDRPEGLENDAFVMYHLKTNSQDYCAVSKSYDVAWANVDGYCKVHFLPNNKTTFTNCTAHTAKEDE